MSRLRIRKFTILDCFPEVGGDKVVMWRIVYTGIVNKKKIQSELSVMGKTKQEAIQNAIRDYGGLA